MRGQSPERTGFGYKEQFMVTERKWAEFICRQLCRFNDRKTQELLSDGFCFPRVGGLRGLWHEQSHLPGKCKEGERECCLSEIKVRLVWFCSESLLQ